MRSLAVVLLPVTLALAGCSPGEPGPAGSCRERAKAMHAVFAGFPAGMPAHAPELRGARDGRLPILAEGEPVPDGVVVELTAYRGELVDGVVVGNPGLLSWDIDRARARRAAAGATTVPILFALEADSPVERLRQAAHDLSEEAPKFLLVRWAGSQPLPLTSAPRWLYEALVDLRDAPPRPFDGAALIAAAPRCQALDELARALAGPSRDAAMQTWLARAPNAATSCGCAGIPVEAWTAATWDGLGVELYQLRALPLNLRKNPLPGAPMYDGGTKVEVLSKALVQRGGQPIFISAPPRFEP